MENQEEQKNEQVEIKEEKETDQSLFFKPVALIMVTIAIVGGWAWYLHSKVPGENTNNNIENNENTATQDSMPVNFSLYDEKGNLITLDDMKEKNVILTFWSTHCTWCLKQLPELYELAKANSNTQFLAVAAGAKQGDLAEFEANKPENVKLLLDTDYEVTQKYSVSGTPDHFIISAAGEFVKEVKGYKSLADFQAILNESF